MIRNDFIVKTEEGVIVNATAYQPIISNKKYEKLISGYKETLEKYIKGFDALPNEEFGNKKEDVMACIQDMEEVIQLLLNGINYCEKTTINIKEERDACINALLMSSGYTPGGKSVE